jgi:hypothetical protein
MLIKLSTDKTVSVAAAALQAAVQTNNFGVMKVHIEADFRNDGKDAMHD